MIDSCSSSEPKRFTLACFLPPCWGLGLPRALFVRVTYLQLLLSFSTAYMLNGLDRGFGRKLQVRTKTELRPKSPDSEPSNPNHRHSMPLLIPFRLHFTQPGFGTRTRTTHRPRHEATSFSLSLSLSLPVSQCCKEETGGRADTGTRHATQNFRESC